MTPTAARIAAQVRAIAFLENELAKARRDLRDLSQAVALFLDLAIPLAGIADGAKPAQRQKEPAHE